MHQEECASLNYPCRWDNDGGWSPARWTRIYPGVLRRSVEMGNISRWLFTLTLIDVMI
ncbi:uncharacterized protein LOC116426500 isoform X2 [Nomia melanderi]|uniref:uncharacterized protein LOC116426500 isoform X2 n=1 Tax=Nomia melanderi TaxID=2448451 RepID=UPI003FCE8049